MGRRTLVRAVTATVLATSFLAAAGNSAAIAETIISVTDPAAQAAAAREFVERLALHDPRPDVQVSAWNALLSSQGDEAIAEFLATGLAEAKARAAERAQRNTEFIQRTNKYSLPGSAVEVTSARALLGSDIEQDEYVRVGLAKAQQADRDTDNQYQEKLVKMAKEDQDYVSDLAAHDPGVQVRAAANRALSQHNEQAIDLFFKYYWASAASLDDESFRRFTADRDAIWHNDVTRLVEAAEAAEKAERAASGELAEKYRADAIDAWRQVETTAEQSSVDWSAEQAKAVQQVDAWAAIAVHARTATSEQDWADVIARGEAGRTSWAAEAAWAQSQADSWKAIADQARASADAAARDGGNS
ncbi:hypothetical protein [Kutzneria sp. NPDC051319]|uniref:hypothetical protein n=1 Tax=Kutzneria sp. NPDC051319 TaxID=3155047 RepID=UPI003445A90F